ncbi:MAG: metalloregulator ArsR/SmtB family transcription factor [Bryobacteraceae bacterium]
MDPVTKRAFKNSLFEQFAGVGKALSSGRRLELLELLAQGERTVEELATQAGLSVANASQHLQVLRSARLVEMRKDGLYARYRLTNDRVLKLWLAFRDFGEMENAEIQRVVRNFLSDRESLEAITVEQLRSRLELGDVVLLDVRPETEYASGHIRGALSVPIADLARRLKSLPKKKAIVAYCRGPYCVFADEAVRLLRAHGYKAQRLEQGFPEWKMLGLPTEAAGSAPGGPA